MATNKDDKLKDFHSVKIGGELSRWDMDEIAILHFGLDIPTLSHLSSANSDDSNYNAHVIRAWRNKNNANKQVNPVWEH